MKRKKQKPMYLRVRLPAIKRAGSGAHQPGKGGKYRRGLGKEKTRKEIEAERE